MFILESVLEFPDLPIQGKEVGENARENNHDDCDDDVNFPFGAERIGHFCLAKGISGGQED